MEEVSSGDGGDALHLCRAPLQTDHGCVAVFFNKRHHCLHLGKLAARLV